MDDQVYQSQIDPLDILSLPTLFKVVPKCGKNGAIIHFQLQSTHWANPSVNQALSFSLFSLNGLCRIPQCPIVINVRYGGGVIATAVNDVESGLPAYATYLCFLSLFRLDLKNTTHWASCGIKTWSIQQTPACIGRFQIYGNVVLHGPSILSLQCLVTH